MGDFRADNVMVKQIGLEGVYMIKPSHNNYDFKFNPIDPTDPNKDQPEVTAPPLVGQSIGWDFIAEPKAACSNICRTTTGPLLLSLISQICFAGT